MPLTGQHLNTLGILDTQNTQYALESRYAVNNTRELVIR